MSSEAAPILVIEGGTVIDPATRSEARQDLLIEGDILREVTAPGKLKEQASARRINAEGLLVIPGMIDLHVHLREPGFEWKETIETGAKAALAGGFTTICCMPNTRPVNDNAEITKFILGKARDAAAAEVLPIGAVSVALLGKEMAPLSELRHAGCVAFSDDGEPVHNSGLMRKALEWCTMLDVPICCHEEDKCLSAGGVMNESALSLRLGLRGWPKVAEEVMIARDIELARATGGHVHFCHVSTARGVELIRRAKNDGIRVTAEVTPHHLTLNEELVERGSPGRTAEFGAAFDTHAKMSPPLREESDVEALIVGLQDGTLDIIASDHAPHDKDSKLVEFDKAAFGILGLQTTVPLMFELVRSGKVSLMRALDALTAKPAQLLKLTGRGVIRAGCEANLALLDPSREFTLSEAELLSKSKNTPYIGRKLKGGVYQVVRRGIESEQFFSRESR